LDALTKKDTHTIKGMSHFARQKKNEYAIGRNVEVDISAIDSQVRIFVIPTDEDLVFLEDIKAILEGTYNIYANFEYSFQRKNFTPTYLQK
jgi:acetate kinase